MLFLLFLITFSSAFMELALSPVRGESAKQMSRSKRDDDKVTLFNRDLVYTVNIEIGSEQQSVTLWLDTRSRVFYVPKTDCFAEGLEMDFYKRDYVSTYQLQNCSFLGTFDPSHLSDFKNLSTDFLFAITSDVYGSGYLAEDTIKIGDLSIKSKFGVCHNASAVGVLGLGYTNEMVLISRSEGLDQVNYLKDLVDNKVIKKQVYSIYLGPNDAEQGQLLFGALDHGKYEGTLQTVKMSPIYYSDLEQDEILVVLDGFLGEGFSEKLQIPVIFDLSTPYLMFSNETIALFARHLNGSYDDYYETYEVDCNLLELDEALAFYFSGVEIKVPVKAMLYESGRDCYIKFDEKEGPDVLGLDILRYLYFVIDLDEREVSLGQAATTNEEADIEAVSDSVPLALNAPYYSYTSIKERYTFDITHGWSTSTANAPTLPDYTMETSKMTFDTSLIEITASSSGGGKPSTTTSANGGSGNTGNGGSSSNSGSNAQSTGSSEKSSSAKGNAVELYLAPLKAVLAMLSLLSVF